MEIFWEGETTTLVVISLVLHPLVQTIREPNKIMYLNLFMLFDLYMEIKGLFTTQLTLIFTEYFPDN